MTIPINLKKVQKLNCSLNVYIFIYLLAHKKLDVYHKYFKTDLDFLDELEDFGVIKLKIRGRFEYAIDGDNIKRANSLLELGDVTWIDEWLDLWPSGVKSMGYYVKGSSAACLDKMNKFVEQTEYDKEVIINATKRYITEMKHKGWKGMQLSHYFIEKNKASTLEAYCHDYIKDGKESVSNSTDDFGISI